MKKLLGVLLVLMSLIFTGCDNNEGPFEIKRENGHKVLYSNGKLAKGMIQSTWYDYNSGESVVTSTYYVEKGIPAGDFTLYDRRGNMLLKAEGKWKDGLFNGKIEERNGTKAVGDFNISKDLIISYDGLGTSDFSYKTLVNGTLKNEYYNFSKKNNKYDKEYIEYYGNGNSNIKLKIQYNEGVYNGKYIEYYENGNKFKEIPYKDNKENGVVKQYYENGKIREELTAVNGIPNGLNRIYYENGKVKAECNFKDGKADGLFKSYYNNGNLKDECNFKDGILDGPAKRYNQNGRLEEEGIFKNDKLISTIEK